eukprot:13088728-Ditylum_brightwellii.AAC.1
MPICKQWWQHKPLQAMVVDKLEITWDYAWDMEVPYDTNIASMTAEEITKYRVLELGLKKMFGLHRISTVLIA